MTQLPESPATHPDSLLVRDDGSTVALKIHCCVWSGRFAPNSRDAIRECHRAGVARAEVDLWLLRDTDGIIDHDGLLKASGGQLLRAGDVRRDEVLRLPAGTRPLLLSEFVDVVAAESFPTSIEIDLKDEVPWPADRVAEVVGRLAPVRERVTPAGSVAETLRSLATADDGLSIGFNPERFLDWLPGERRHELLESPGPDGWVNRTGATNPSAGVAALRQIVPAARELHLRLETLERLMLEAATDPIRQLHDDGWIVDAWTLDADTDGWRGRLEAAVAAGVDMITTNTAPILARAHREGLHSTEGPGVRLGSA